MRVHQNQLSFLKESMSVTTDHRWWLGLAMIFMLPWAALGQSDSPLVGVWAIDDGWQVRELLFRSDGRYQADSRNADPTVGFSLTERGRYEVNGQTLALMPYEYFGEPQPKLYQVELSGGFLTLTTPGDFPLVDVYQFKSGSREDVLARQNVPRVLIGSWKRSIVFWGDEEYTFRPGGYYVRKDTPESGNFPPDYIRGRYGQEGDLLTIAPYSGIEAAYEIDFFGNTLTLIRAEEFSGESASYEQIPGTEEEVRTKTAEADEFLSREHWYAGVWQMTNSVFDGELTLRSDGYYMATNNVEILRGMVRGRYTLDSGRITLHPFLGQDIYSRDNGDFGKVERVRELDYYDGALQWIDLESLSQSVTLARKVPGSEASVLEKTRQAQAERAQDGWQIGIWEVRDPAGWMEFTFRPDNRYIAKSGTDSVPSQVERGQYVLKADKLTLAPYSGLGPARGFELDLYDGNLFLVGDSHRMVIARKIPGSESEVIEKTRNPESTKSERGGILGLWTANRPGESVELVFRPDGHFRLKRCAFDAISHDYGLYSVDMTARALVYDSRFTPVQTQGLDFYGDTLTIYGGLSSPSTYTVNLGTVDAAIAASMAADAEEAKVDAQWLARVPVGPRDPNAVQIPGAGIPADPNPGRLFDSATVLGNYQLYRRLIPGFVYFNHLGEIKSVAVTHTREWHFFPTGRVLVRFRNQSAGPFYPTTIETISDGWGAYTVGGKPEEQDILHVFADNALFIDSDLGEQMDMTLEDGRRNLFLEKDYQILSEWAAERKPVPCELPGDSNPSLVNVAVSLSTTIPPDTTGSERPIQFRLSGPVAGNFILSGTLESAGNLVIEQALSLTPPVAWQAVQTNTLPAGPFSLQIGQGTNAMSFFRLGTQP
ncbi:MAG: hypothetical protein AB9869_02795 [Verrucomicrobiia bacterium]